MRLWKAPPQIPTSVIVTRVIAPRKFPLPPARRYQNITPARLFNATARVYRCKAICFSAAMSELRDSRGNGAIWRFFTGGPLIETQPRGKHQRSYPLTEAHRHPSVDLSPARQPLMKVRLRCLNSLRSAEFKWCLETPDITEFNC